MILIDVLKKFFLIIFGNTWVQNDKICPFLRVFFSLNFKIKSIFFEVKMHLHLFFEEKRPHFESEVKMLTLIRDKVVSVFSDYLIVLFIYGVFKLVDNV